MGKTANVTVSESRRRWPESYGVIAPDLEMVRAKGSRENFKDLVGKAVVLASSKINPNFGIDAILRFSDGGSCEATIIQVKPPLKRNRRIPERQEFLVRIDGRRGILHAVIGG